MNTSILAWGFGIYSVLMLGSMATMSVGIGVVLAAMLIACRGPLGLLALIRDGLREKEMRRYFGLTLFVTFACALSLMVAQVHPISHAGKTPVVEFWKDMSKAWYFFWPLVLVPGLKLLSNRQKKAVLTAWLVAFGLLSLLGIFQYFYGWPKDQGIPWNEPHYHVTLFFGHHLSVASIFIFPFFIALDLLRWNLFSKKFLAAVLIVGLIALVGTWSRTLWAALPIGILIWFAWILPRKWAVATVLSAIVTAVLLTQLPFVKKRMEYFGGITERKLLWQANTDFFMARPLTGSGWHHNLELSGWWIEEHGDPAVPIFSGHAHNNFIEVMGSMGLAGIAAWIMWNFFVVRLPIRYRKTRDALFARGMVCAWIVFHINGLTQVNFFESKVMHSMMWMVAWSLVWAAQSREKE